MLQMTECRPAGRNFKFWRLRRTALHAPSTASRVPARRGVALAFCAADHHGMSHLKTQILRRRAPRASVLAGRSSPLSPFRYNSRAAPPFSVLLAGPFRAPPGRAAPPFSSLQARPLLSPASHPTGYLSHSSSLAGRKREECPSRQGALSPLFNLFCSAVRYCPNSGGGLRMRAPASGAGSPGSEASTRAARQARVYSPPARSTVYARSPNRIRVRLVIGPP